jgi:putative ABC transport system permease protein
MPFPVGETLVQDYPDYVEVSTRFFNMQAPAADISYEPEGGEPVLFSERRFFFADSTVFDVFDFELVRGDPSTALSKPNTILVTESTAQRFFGQEDPIGKTLRLNGQFPIDLEVVGILGDTPRNSHFEFDLLASMATLNQFSPNGNFQSQNWYWNPAWTYIVLAENVDPQVVEAQFPAFVEQYFPDNIKAIASMYLMPLADIHLHSKLDFEIRPNSDIAYVYIFTVIAIFVLLIACINFMNLSTARSGQRAREVGVRKAVGAGRSQLVRQFLGESLISAFLAAVFAVPLIYAALPVLNNIAEKTLSFNPVVNLFLVSILVGVPAVVGLLSGLYPAFFLSAFQPAAVLKGTLISRGASAAVWLRRGLVSSQFVVSMVLIAGTIVAYKQLDYMRNKKLGFDKEEVVLVNIQLTGFWQSYEAFKDEVEQNPNIRHVTIIEDVPGSKYQTSTYTPEGLNEDIQFPRLSVHDDFVETFGMELAAGRGYSRDFPADSSESIMVNMALARQLGWNTPEEALGRRIQTAGGPNGPQPREVIGVFNDFHYSSLHNPIGAFVVERYNSQQTMTFFGRYMAIRIAPNDVSGTLAFIEDRWDRYVANRALDYFFLDDELDQLYKAEATLGKVATIFSILAIFVACLGLFGMASFSAERRIKEIGIRKVVGASVPRIILLLSKESVQMVGLAFLVAAPIAYFALDRWLQGFSYHTEQGFLPIAIAGAVVLIISWATVGAQSVKAASVDPVQSLRYE